MRVQPFLVCQHDVGFFLAPQIKRTSSVIPVAAVIAAYFLNGSFFCHFKPAAAACNIPQCLSKDIFHFSRLLSFVSIHRFGVKYNI